MIKEKPFTKLLGLIVVGAVVLAACAGQNGAKMGMAEKAKKEVAKAEEAVEETRQSTDGTGLWKSTMKVFDQARSSLEEGEYETAIDKAGKARYQAEKGLAQYREEQEQYQLAVKAGEGSQGFDEQAMISGNAPGE
ncbi:MAG: hypothetical protein ACLFRB_10925 [Thiohalorhabdus sp.]|uniref:hypothetical protein n=1 Tax=Thiohalorhabdus sp. TaxID=3094134 RepID=UPI00397FD457